ncbi:MAG: hypothetical protein K8S99_03570 [Planctomycetes bacterium]|nr:hypothetical protein [Planctomycetota bacterium]
MSERAKRERASKGRDRGGKATPEQTKDRLSDNVVDKRSKAKTDTRAAAAKSSGVSERKVRDAVETSNRDDRFCTGRE